MADLIAFPDKIKGPQPVSITLRGDLWLALMLKLGNRGHDVAAVKVAEALIMEQLAKWEG